MTRVVMEHVEYELNVPETGVQPDSLTFVEIDQEKCIGCDTCQQYCPTGAIYGETFEPHTIKYRELCINCGQCLTHCPSMAIYEVRSWVPKLEEKLKDTKDAFLRNSMMLVVDAVEPEKVKTLLETELEYLDERHVQDRAFYDKASAYSPAFGMIGTLIGLILMLKDMNDASTIGPKMAVALVTTLYG